MSTTKVARLVELGKPLEIGTAEKPKPGPKDVLVKVATCCLVPNSHNIITNGGGDDIAYLPELPCVFGLDAAGTIEKVGDHVFGLKPGDRVYVDPWLTCGTCSQCRMKRQDLCSNACLRAYFAQSPGGAEMLKQYPMGALSGHLTSPAANIAVLPDSIDLKLAARFGYIGTSFSGLKKAQLKPGKTLLINGVTGTLGYAAVAIALGFGCTKILGIGRNKERLAQLEKLSPTGRIATFSSEGDEDIVEWVKQQTKGVGVDALYDCLGNGGDASITSKLISAVKRGGHAILAAGGSDGKIVQKSLDAMTHDVAILGTMWFDSADVDELIALIDAKVMDFSFLTHKVFSLDQVNEAFKFVGDRPGGAVNVIVQHDS